MVDPLDVERVFKAIRIHGLRLQRHEISERERDRQCKTITRLLEDNAANTLIDAIKYGMPNVWPISTDGRCFDANDLDKNLLKAKGEVGIARRSGQIPSTMQRRNW